MTNEISIKNLSYEYKSGEKVLNEIDLEVSKGDFIGVIGHTGSGKSTLLKHLNGILRKTSGSVEILGNRIDKESKRLNNIRKRIGVIFQFPEEQLFSETSREDIYFAPRNFKISEEDIAKNLKELIPSLKLTEEILEKPFFELSGGEKRKVSIASIMVSKPEILVLDEPTIGLDYESKEELLKLLKEINDKGTTIIVVTHDLSTMWEYLDRVVLLEGGKKIFDDKKIELLKKKKYFKGKKIFFPEFIEYLDTYGLLKGNEDRVINKEKALEIIEENLEVIKKTKDDRNE